MILCNVCRGSRYLLVRMLGCRKLSSEPSGDHNLNDIIYIIVFPLLPQICEWITDKEICREVHKKWIKSQCMHFQTSLLLLLLQQTVSCVWCHSISADTQVKVFSPLPDLYISNADLLLFFSFYWHSPQPTWSLPKEWKMYKLEHQESHQTAVHRT